MSLLSDVAHFVFPNCFSLLVMCCVKLKGTLKFLVSAELKGVSD